MKLVYQVNERPKFGRNLVYAIQQFLAIIAATILVPILADASGQYLSQSAALIGAGVGTLIYVAFTRMKSPVFLGSSFAFITPLSVAVAYGYCGIIFGSLIAGLVYVVIALVIRKVGAGWINKLMPPVIIGPTVALIGLSLSGSAMNNVQAGAGASYNLWAVLVAMITFFTVVVVSVKGKRGMKMIPFVIGVLAGYASAAIITLVGYYAFGVQNCCLIDFTLFADITVWKNWIPNITFVGAFQELLGQKPLLLDGSGIVSVIVAFAPVALVVFAEHVADHKNISSIIEKDLLEDPGLDKTLLGDGVGSIGGAFFGGCPNTTYGESIGCVAITGNASVYTILTTAVVCIVVAFFYPIMLFVETIPTCVVGGICIALYGFIAVSGLRMFKHVDLDDSKNLFIVAGILVTGIGGLVLNIGEIQITSIACALIIGILLNLILKPEEAKVEKKVVVEDKKEEPTLFGNVYTEEGHDENKAE